MAGDAKKEAERKIFDLVYGNRESLEVTASERPDFIVQDKKGRFGVEVTEFFDTESKARLQRIEGYAGDLLEGKPHRHKADRQVLKVTKVDYERRDGSGRITGIPAIMQ